MAERHTTVILLRYNFDAIRVGQIPELIHEHTNKIKLVQ